MVSTVKFKDVPKAIYRQAYLLEKLFKSSVLAMQGSRNVEVTSLDFFYLLSKNPAR